MKEVKLKRFVSRSILKVTKLYQPSIVEPLLHTKVTNSDGSERVILGSDVTLLFNQERLNQLGTDTLNKFIDMMNNYPSDKMAELRSKVSDEDMFKFIKSRNYQSLGELKSWCKYLSDNLDVELDEYAKRQDKIAEEKKKKADEERVNSIKEFLKAHPEYKSVSD